MPVTCVAQFSKLFSPQFDDDGIDGFNKKMEWIWTVLTRWYDARKCQMKTV